MLGALSALASLVGTGYSIWQSQNERPDYPAAWEDYKRAAPAASEQLASILYNPMFEGSRPPYGQPISYAPPESLNQMYSHYLTRSYGLPQNVARGMQTQAMQPMRRPEFPAGARPNQIGTRSTVAPQQMVQSALGYQQPLAMKNMDYLQNAAKLAQFNAWRSQQLPRLLG
jgi:hypothetical protein